MPFRMAHINYLATSPLEQGAIWPWYSTTNLNRATLPPETPLGAYWELQGNFQVGGGNAFMLVKNVGGAIALGDVVTWTAPAASTITAAGSTVNTLVWAAGGLTVGAEVGNLLYLANTAGSNGFLIRRIIANTATTLTIAPAAGDPMVAATAAGVRVNTADALDAVPTNGDVGIIIRPFNVKKCTSVLVPVGVALGTVTDGYYTVIQVAGIGLAKGTNNGAALAVGIPAIVDAGTAGVLTGTAAASINTNAGNFTSLAAYNAAGPTLQPFNMNCFAQL